MKRQGRRLDRVLRVREVEEGVVRAQWASMEARAARAREATQALYQAHAQAQADLSQQLSAGNLSPAAAMIAHRTIENLGSEIVAATERQSQAEAAAEEARAPWEAKRKERRGLEILVERAQLEALEQARAEESANLDEVASQRAARTQRLETGRNDTP